MQILSCVGGWRTTLGTSSMLTLLTWALLQGNSTTVRFTITSPLIESKPFGHSDSEIQRNGVFGRNDLYDTSASYVNGIHTCKFTRKRDTGDTSGDKVILGSLSKVCLPSLWFVCLGY